MRELGKTLPETGLQDEHILHTLAFELTLDLVIAKSCSSNRSEISAPSIPLMEYHLFSF